MHAKISGGARKPGDYHPPVESRGVASVRVRPQTLKQFAEVCLQILTAETISFEHFTQLTFWFSTSVFHSGWGLRDMLGLAHAWPRKC